MGQPTRTCIGCRTATAQAELVRLALVGSAVHVDRDRRLPGRGAWIHLDEACVEQAERRRAWGRALRATGPLDVAAVRDALDLPL